MTTLLVTIHFIVALAIIGLILLQQGKGSEMGASFGGGGSNTVFGATGGFSFFAKATAILATVFFITSFALALSARHQATGDLGGDLNFLDVGLPSLPASQQDIPVAPAESFEFQEFPSAPQTDEVESAPSAE